MHVGEQSGSISVFTSNACGTSSVNLPVTFCGGGEPGGGIIIRSNTEQPSLLEQTSRKVLVFPNPTNGGFAVELNPQFYSSEEGKYAQLINLSGKVVYENDFIGNALTINAKNAIPGIYFLKVRYEGHFVVEKIIIY
ncbi:MAG: T9SS type A sorting domain-containing protein [Saprospiraceae bacterium]